ncbi:MAG TPA: class I SAM-dependent methyltransferase [Polyangiaceae bacterium]|jgi:SAM-dependent methyltransferase
MPIEQDTLNRSTWSTRSSRRWLDSVGTFSDPGEQVLFDLLRDQIRGAPVLDLGVGTGRTIPLFRSLTSDYRAIDYLPSMVEVCRQRYASVRIDVGDARDLEGVPSRHFALVYFSFNGIDAVDREGRARVLDSMRRVVRDDGVVAFSALNLNGPAFRERPWTWRVAPARHPALRAFRAARALSLMPIETVRWSRLQSQCVSGEGWAIAPLSAHGYGVLAHFTTLERQLQDLEEARLDRDVLILESDRGERVRPGDDTSSAAWLHFIVRPR